MALSIVVVCEARADFVTAKGLIDRVVCDSVEWAEPEHVAYSRTYRGLEGARQFALWREIDRRAKDVGLGFKGHFNGRPAEADAIMAWRALLLIRLQVPNADAVLLLRDVDDQPRRRAGLEQARDDSILSSRTVIGLAQTKREAWVLAGFEPANDIELEALSKIRQELGFNPCEHAERLTAKHDHDKLSAKRVLGRLTIEDPDREAACCQTAPLDVLRDRGGETGLAAFIQEVEERIVPLFGWRDHPR
jgi:hypothetical protein